MDSCCSSSLPAFLPSFLVVLVVVVQEVHQLQVKQDGLFREISDLQETVEWKNKKISVGL